MEEDAIALGFFSFAKFLMYRDLDPETWSDCDALLNHPLLNTLMGDAGFASFPPQVSEDSQLDEALRGREPILVDNADSSQTLALVESLAGRNLVIQGPPGTGKSQTIVNLIAAAVGAGKKVLFVSEKLAALQVVKRRLDKLGLGAACLELHSNKTRKRELIEELRRTVHMTRLQTPQLNAEMALLRDHRDRLNDYCTAVNGVVGESGETPLSIYGKLLSVESQLNGISASSFRFADSLKWTAGDVARKRLVAEQLRNSLHQSGPPAAHPFWGSKKRSYLPTEGEALARTLTSVRDAIGNLQAAIAALASHFQIPVPDSPHEVELLAGTAQLLTRSPTPRRGRP